MVRWRPLFLGSVCFWEELNFLGAVILPELSREVLVALYEEPEKPNSALDFLKHHLGASAPENPEIEALRLEVAEMKEKYEAVLEENKKLKTKLAQYEPPQDEKHGE
nr:PREDICTED: C-Myc-binding protein [Opisthocomus hoazin]